jgi:hypothetical protein
VNVIRARQPCGMCLCYAPTYEWFLRRSKSSKSGFTVDLERTTCPAKLRFQHHQASTFKQSAPCTNVPLNCLLCSKINPESPAIWKYNLQAHFQSHHASINLALYAHYWDIGPSETNLLRAIYQARMTIPKHRKTKQNSTNGDSMQISEARSTRWALRYACIYLV